MGQGPKKQHHDDLDICHKLTPNQYLSLALYLNYIALKYIKNSMLGMQLFHRSG